MGTLFEQMGNVLEAENILDSRRSFCRRKCRPTDAEFCLPPPSHAGNSRGCQDLHLVAEKALTGNRTEKKVAGLIIDTLEHHFSLNTFLHPSQNRIWITTLLYLLHTILRREHIPLNEVHCAVSAVKLMEMYY